MGIDYCVKDFRCASAFALIIADDTKRILSQYRHDGQWGLFGGKTYASSDDAMAKGLQEQLDQEAGLSVLQNDLEPVYDLNIDDFQLSRFFAYRTDREFAPSLNFESRGFLWVGMNHWPQPMHRLVASAFPALKEEVSRRGRSNIDPVMHPQPR